MGAEITLLETLLRLIDVVKLNGEIQTTIG